MAKAGDGTTWREPRLGTAGASVAASAAADASEFARHSELRRYFADQGVELVGSTPEEYAAFIRTDIAKWEKVIRETGIKAN